MAHIHLTPPEEATGLLKRLYDAAIARAGKVFQVIRAQSPRPKVLKASTQLYLEVMYGESGLSRAERELVATVVSRANHCRYWTRAHGEDLRVEVQGRGDAEELVAAAMEDYTRFDWSPRERAILDYAVKLTRQPGVIERGDVERLRAAGLDDPSIHDVVQVTALFNYYDRIADGLGIEMEPDWG